MKNQPINQYKDENNEYMIAAVDGDSNINVNGDGIILCLSSEVLKFM